MAQKFRTRIVEIEATRFTGDNWDEMLEWTENSFRQAMTEGLKTHEGLPLTGEVFDKLHNAWIGVAPGQWIVRGVKGEYYPCDDETFFWKYEPVEEVEAISITVSKNRNGPLLSLPEIELDEQS